MVADKGCSIDDYWKKKTKILLKILGLYLLQNSCLEFCFRKSFSSVNEDGGQYLWLEILFTHEKQMQAGRAFIQKNEPYH